MNLLCMSKPCSRHLAAVEGVTSGKITLPCPRCGGRSTFHFDETERISKREFDDKRRDGASVSHLKRELLTPEKPAPLAPSVKTAV